MMLGVALLSAVVCGPIDFSRDAAFRREFKEAALAIARRKTEEGDVYRQKNVRRTDLKTRIATGGSFGGYFLWDTAFAVIWASRLPKGVMPAMESLDNLYALADENGFICREYTANGVRVWEPTHPNAFAPPLLAWAEMELFGQGQSDVERLKSVYSKLKRHHEFCKAHYRRDDGLYFGDMLGCGMDDLKRYPRGMTTNELLQTGGIPFTADSVGPESKRLFSSWLFRIAPQHCWNRQMIWIDMSAQMALDARQLAEMADRIGKSEDAASWRTEHGELSEAINRFCWSEEMGFYGDCYEGRVIPRKSAAAFWTLLAKVATPKRAERMCQMLKDKRFFGRPVPFPALSADDPDYNPEKGYWQGSSWPPTTYVAIRGLREYGFEKEAEEAARRYYNANAALFRGSGTIFENISPEQCQHPKARAARDFCGWGALAPVALPCDFKW